MRFLILILAFFFISFSTSFAQLMDYVKEVKGDTLVVKDYYDMGNAPNSINNVVLVDTADVPAGRVYELQSLGWYPQSGGFTTPSNRPCVIVGAGKTLVQATVALPIISGYSDESGALSTGGITWGNDLTVKKTAVLSAVHQMVQ